MVVWSLIRFPVHGRNGLRRDPGRAGDRPELAGHLGDSDRSLSKSSWLIYILYGFLLNPGVPALKLIPAFGVKVFHRSQQVRRQTGSGHVVPRGLPVA
jgi:hypothetical protein